MNNFILFNFLKNVTFKSSDFNILKLFVKIHDPEIPIVTMQINILVVEQLNLGFDFLKVNFLNKLGF